MKLIINNLTKKYDNNIVLEDINYSFNSGKIYGILGRNGAGKTTLFNALNSDIKIDSGKFYLEENNIKKPLLETSIGYIVSEPVVPEFLTGKEFLKFYLDINKDKITNIKDIDYYFNLVDLDKQSQNILLKEYSHGMKNKMQILINIITNPKIILLDEPLTSLDIIAQEDMKNLLKKLKKDHIIILSTHIVELALDLCDEIVLLNNKKLSSIDNKLNEKDKLNLIIEKLRSSNV